MKILIVADPTIPVPPIFYGGIERIVDGLINEYLKLGHEVCLLCHKDSLPNPKCEVFYYSKTENNIVSNSLRVLFVYLKCRPDLIHSFGRLINTFLLSICKIPIVFSYQREPNVLNVKWMVLLTQNRHLVFTGCSKYISSKLSRYCKVFTIYNFSKKANLNNVKLSQNAPLIFLGRIEEIKGVHIAIEVAQKCNDDLLICGNLEADHIEYFNNYIRPHLNDKIKYMGSVNDYDKFNYLKISKALLMPITWDEPFGIVMVESFSVGTPVIGFGRGSVKEVVRHGVNGFVCETLDEMVGCVNCVVNIDRAQVYRDFLSRFTVEVIAEEYLNVYTNTILGHD